MTKVSSIGSDALVFCAAFVMLAGCGGTQSQFAVPSVASQNAAAVATKFSCRTSPCIYVTNAGNESITAYPTSAKGDVAPVETLAGPDTGLSWPYGIAFDSAGNIDVANFFGNSINVYAAGSRGDARPMRTISGPRTGLAYPSGLAVDGGGNVYAKNGYDTDAMVVTIYSRKQHGNALPSREIIGAEHPGEMPFNVAVDGAGNFYVARPKCGNYGSGCVGTDKVMVYGPGANRHSRPIRTISGSRTQLNAPGSIAVDNDGNVYVANSNNFQMPNTVTVYAAGAHGNVAPIQIISGQRTELYQPDAIVVDTKHNIYVTNYDLGRGGAVLVFAAGSSGNVRPRRVITGGNTGLLGPEGIAIH